jgi:hypothetical protein
MYNKKNEVRLWKKPGFLTLFNNIPTSSAYGVYISQLIRYERACSTYDQLIRDSVLTNKLMYRGFLKSRLQAAFRKFDGRYNDLVCQYNFHLGQMLSDVFHTNL